MTVRSLSVCLLACAVHLSAQSAPANPLARSQVFALNAMRATTAPNGVVGRKVFSGTLATGEAVAVHETTQPAGAPPSPMHRIGHSEVIVVVEGTIEFDHDEKAERAGQGSVVYVASGTLHFIRNVGSGPATYVVVQVGGDTRQ